jgi:molybdopterin-containing oxidoreductase family iron-sulfur binding subunit
MSQVNEKPKYWRSLAELESDPEFVETVQREWRVPLDQEPSTPERRRFLQVMGASFAFAGLTGCRWKEDKMVDFAKRPEGYVPGEPRYYATSMDVSGNAVGLVATSYDGRPIKIEGNPKHPASLGAAGVWHQATLLELYDPDRSQSVAKAGKKVDWTAFADFAKEHFGKLKASAGAGLYVLSGVSSSPSLADMRRRFSEKFPQAKWLVWEPLVGNEADLGTKLVFGKPHRVHLDVGKADVIVSLDCDFISGNYPNALANERALADRRSPDHPKMNRVYAIESVYSHVGSVADHRLAIRSGQIKAFVSALDAMMTSALGGAAEYGAAQQRPNAPFLEDKKVAKFLETIGKELVANKGKSLLVTGDRQPPEVHALVARINGMLGNAGQTVWYTELPEEPTHAADLQTLVGDLSSGKVDTLIVLGQNPVFTAPADLGFESAYKSAKTSIAVTTFEDETAKVSSWHVPLAHWLETWGDTVAHDGTLGISQPLVAPLFGSKSALELLSLVIDGAVVPGKDIVRRTHKATFADERKWRRLVHDGASLPAPTTEKLAPKPQALSGFAFEPHELGGLEAESNQLELIFVADSKIYDGRWANNAWLQELPDPFGKLTWGNVATLSPETAKKLNVSDGTPVSVTVGGKSMELPAMIAPGQAKGTIKVSLGYGRLSAGVVGGDAGDVPAKDPVGTNAYPLRTTKTLRIAPGASLSGKGERQYLATTQDVHAIDAVGAAAIAWSNDKKKQEGQRVPQLLRDGTLEEYKKDPSFAKHAVHHPPLLSLWKDPVSYDGHKWGMAIDLSKCTGCNACITACQSENNIAVVGIENVKRGREMLWLRIDRYYKGDAETAELGWQPLPCQQCENAPCEQVCPVGATMHSTEGLNDMVYNRCIGTRYCANNCPYKVRRFNYLNYHLDKVGPTPWHGMENDRHRVKAMVFNPEVTVRARGVMEKCTFCVQRIQNVKIKAKNAKRPIADGEIKTACQQTCAANAIVFGDLNDGASEVAKLQNSPRAYKLLEELNDRPRVSYLARIKNPNPELG